MNLTGLHLLLTCQCTLACDHCFVWGSPWQSGVMTQPALDAILRQAGEAGTVRSIAFEGGEPFLYYPTLLYGVREAARLGFQTSIVTNAYWATSPEDAITALAPFAGYLHSLSVSSDWLHWSDPAYSLAQNATAAAERFGIQVGTISIARPETPGLPGAVGQLPSGLSPVMFRGRAAEKLAGQVPGQPWDSFNACPHENLDEPGRVHLDPFGNLHICQGILLGNIFQTSLKAICASYVPRDHPISGPLLVGGPAGLVRRYALPRADRYADACHLCYSARLALRDTFPDHLAPAGMYGVL